MYTKFHSTKKCDIDFTIIYFVDSRTAKVVDSFSIMNCPFDLAFRISKLISRVPNYYCDITLIKE